VEDDPRAAIGATLISMLQMRVPSGARHHFVGRNESQARAAARDLSSSEQNAMNASNGVPFTVLFSDA
jgi:hypothetical protein